MNCGFALAALFVIGFVPVREQTAALAGSDRREVQSASSVTGKVVSQVAAGTPVRRAVVRLSSPALVRDLAAITDDGGEFSFSGLMPGQYVVTAQRKHYVPANNGTVWLAPSEVRFELRPGQHRTDVTLLLRKGSVLTGVVTDESGDPVVDAQILLFAVSGNRRSQIAVTTDDRGMYRGAGLLPGRYVIAAVVRQAPVEGLEITSDTEVDAVLRQLAARRTHLGPVSDITNEAGGHGVRNNVGHSSGVPGFVPIYYPSATTVDDAAPISLGWDEERSGIDIIFRPVVTSSLEGAVKFPPGAAATPVGIELAQIGSPVRLRQNNRFESKATGATNMFQYKGLAPGRYRLTARTLSTPSLCGIAEVYVGAQNVGNVVVELLPSSVVSGSLAFDMRPSDSHVSLAGMGVRLNKVSIDPGETSITAGVDARGKFRFADILPGVYELSVEGPLLAEGLWLKSATSAARNILDTEFVIEPGTEIHPVLTLTAEHNELAGAIRAEREPAVAVLIFPVDSDLWTAGSRRIRLVGLTPDLRYSALDLQPGNYFVALIRSPPPGDPAEPSFLREASAGATIVSIAQGQRTVQDLQ